MNKKQTMFLSAVLGIGSVMMLSFLIISAMKADVTGCAVTGPLNINAGGADALRIENGGDLVIYEPAEYGDGFAKLYVNTGGELITPNDFKINKDHDGVLKIGDGAGANAQLCLNNECFTKADLMAGGSGGGGNLPLFTAEERDALSPDPGMMIYNTDVSEIQAYIPTQWKTVVGGQSMGSVCTASVQCETGFCVDGVCCDSACDGSACQRCDSHSIKGAGYCGYVASSSEDPDNECATGLTSSDGCRSDYCSGIGYSCGSMTSGDGGCPVCKTCSDSDIACENHDAVKDTTDINTCFDYGYWCEAGNCVQSSLVYTCAETDCAYGCSEGCKIAGYGEGDRDGGTYGACGGGGCCCCLRCDDSQSCTCGETSCISQVCSGSGYSWCQGFGYLTCTKKTCSCAEYASEGYEGISDIDADGDGYVINVDCDDNCATCYPGSTEYTLYPDGKDQDCNGIVDDFEGEEMHIVLNEHTGQSCNDLCSNNGYPPCSDVGTDDAATNNREICRNWLMGCYNAGELKDCGSTTTRDDNHICPNENTSAEAAWWNCRCGDAHYR